MKLKDKNLYYIGGIVRDEILGKKSFDTDLTYIGNAVKFAKNISGVEIVRINNPFKTVKINLDGEEIDIASTRNETYPQKGHLPKVSKIGCSLKEDILRRDFTINALAKSTLTGEIIDYTGGLDDIKNKTLRVLHDKSFIDDPTRIVRGLKFSIRFGFELDENTRKLQETYLNNINYDMSYKRLQKELKETFDLNSQKAFEKFVNQRIYKLITNQDFNLPKINFEELINKYKPQNIWIIYAGQIPDIKKLPLTKKEIQIIDNFHILKEKQFDTDIEIYKNFRNVPTESIIMFSQINFEAVTRYLDYLCQIHLETTGTDLINLGLKPSKKYRQCFEYLLVKKFENPKLTKINELNLAKEFIKNK